MKRVLICLRVSCTSTTCLSFLRDFMIRTMADWGGFKRGSQLVWVFYLEKERENGWWVFVFGGEMGNGTEDGET